MQGADMLLQRAAVPRRARNRRQKLPWEGTQEKRIPESVKSFPSQSRLQLTQSVYRKNQGRWIVGGLLGNFLGVGISLNCIRQALPF
jgi:hypothetical protein